MRLFSARVENVTVGREMCALDPKRRRYCVISCEKKGGIFDPRIELGTFCVLSRRDNRLHQPNLPGVNGSDFFSVLGCSSKITRFLACCVCPRPQTRYVTPVTIGVRVV